MREGADHQSTITETSKTSPLNAGLDVPLVNNYGVWLDEFEALGMAHTLEVTFPDAVCYFGEGKEVKRS